MIKISDFTWEWLDLVGWCDCQPRQDQCQVCKAKRARERQQQAPQPKVFTGQPQLKPKRMDFE